MSIEPISSRAWIPKFTPRGGLNRNLCPDEANSDPEIDPIARWAARLSDIKPYVAISDLEICVRWGGGARLLNVVPRGYLESRKVKRKRERKKVAITTRPPPLFPPVSLFSPILFASPAGANFVVDFDGVKDTSRSNFSLFCVYDLLDQHNTSILYFSTQNLPSGVETSKHGPFLIRICLLLVLT